MTLHELISYNKFADASPTAIVLPEQSVAAEKTGLAVNKKGLTLKELLQQTSHHNAKVRRGIVVLSERLLM